MLMPYETYQGHHFLRYISVSSLGCTPETKIILYVNNNQKIKNYTGTYIKLDLT